jgi:GTPase SAR1 family protein
MRVFSGDEFSESMLATAGYVLLAFAMAGMEGLLTGPVLFSVDFKLRHINVADEEIALQIWDTAGQERFHRITASTSPKTESSRWLLVLPVCVFRLGSILQGCQRHRTRV